MELKEMRQLGYQDLLEKLKEAQRKLFDFKMQLAGQQLKNFMQIGQIRKEIARMHTVLTEKRSKGEQVTDVKPLVEEKAAAKKENKKEVKKEEHKKVAKEKKTEDKPVKKRGLNLKLKKEKVKVKE